MELFGYDVTSNKSAKCPICKAPASVGDVQICGYTEEVLSVASTKDVENAVIFPDGRYRIDIKGAEKLKETKA